MTSKEIVEKITEVSEWRSRMGESTTRKNIHSADGFWWLYELQESTCQWICTVGPAYEPIDLKAPCEYQAKQTA